MNVTDMVLFKSLIDSFCRTASLGYTYNFYLAYDAKDPILSKKETMTNIYNSLKMITSKKCSTHINVGLHFVQCNHNYNPAWAQNDALLEAYLDHADYYYRVNDDTVMLTPGWTEIYIEGLQGFSPPNVGVVGPLHKGGNEDILTYDFVHRTHINIFGYYYPRIFTDWWADNWISFVYGSSHTLKLPSVRLLHTSEIGTRYNVKPNKKNELKKQIEEDQETLKRYLQMYKQTLVKTNNNKLIKKVISISLWGSKTRYSYGAIRNLQLLPVHFPGWVFRIYVEKPLLDGSTNFPNVPNRILRKLKIMGAEIIEVNYKELLIPPMMWRFLVADDMDVHVFIVRDADCRLSQRDAIVVEDWLSHSSYPFHCIRDHPSHADAAVLGGLWGGKPAQLKDIFSVPWSELMMGLRSDYTQDMIFLSGAIWPKVKDSAYCHDSISCNKWKGAVSFPIARIGTEHLGQVFDAFGNVKGDDVKILLENPINKRCLRTIL